MVLTVALPLLGASEGQAQERAEGDRAAIAAVISQQIEAYQRDDGAAAFAFASPAIQNLFQTPQNFLDMVRRDYQPVYRPKEVRFRALEIIEGRLVQKVFLVGPDGVPVVAAYFMEQQAAGDWRIGGCLLLRDPAFTT
ncbi:MAG: DUF4864 domain-containing protein [Alphaproteobacteria bacterium]|nr:DUF4864 domain-containing protein [Alphaproteobacteria bacterium]